MDLEAAQALEFEANELNGGCCTHCHQTIKIYRYGISDSMVTVLRAMAKSTTPQAGRAYAHVRKPEYHKTVTAIYNGISVGALVRGNKYSIKMAKLQTGKPLDIEVQLDEPKQLSYSDIAAFGKSWQVV